MTVDLHQVAHRCADAADPALPRAAKAWCAQLHQLVCNEIDCYSLQLEVWPFGSAWHGTHLATSDIDLAVTPKHCQAGHTTDPDPRVGTACDMFGLRNFLVPRLQRRFGAKYVEHSDKSIIVLSDGARPPIDLVVLLPQTWEYGRCPHCGEARCAEGFEIRSFNEQTCAIATWPTQHRERVRQIDSSTQGWFTSRVRAIKGVLRHGPFRSQDTALLPSVLIENLVGCVSESCFRSRSSCPFADIKHIFRALEKAFHAGKAQDFQEISLMRNLFDDAQTWSAMPVHDAIQRISQQLR